MADSDLLAEVVEVAAGLVDLAQLLLDRLQLLAEDVFALVAPHLLLHLAVDLLADLQHLVLARQEPEHLAQARLEVERLQHVLLLVHLDVQVRDDHVGQLARLDDAVDQRARLLGQLGHQLDDPLGDVLDVHHQRVQLDVGDRRIGQRLNPGGHERVAAADLEQPDAGDALQDDREVVLGELDDLQDPRRAPDHVEVAGPGSSVRASRWVTMPITGAPWRSPPRPASPTSYGRRRSG